MKEYKVVAYNPYTYVVLVKKVETTGAWFWKKAIVNWVECDVDGNPYQEYNRNALPRCRHFTNYGAAARKMNQFNG